MLLSSKFCSKIPILRGLKCFPIGAFKNIKSNASPTPNTFYKFNQHSRTRTSKTSSFPVPNHIHNIPISILCENNLSIAPGLRYHDQVINRCFHTSPRRDAIPPLILLALSKLGKVAAALAGRQFRNWWWKSLPPEQRTEYITTARNNRKYLYGLIALLGLGGYGYYQVHMEETPLTGRRRLLLFSDEQIDEISKHELEMLVEMHKKNILDRSDLRHKKVYDVAIRLVTANRDLLQKYGKNKNWTVSVVDDKTANAFVLSCGNIFVFTGLLSICDDKDGDPASRLAIILGHELSHVLLNHSAEQASLLHFLDLLLIVPVVILWTILPSDATAALSQWVVGKLTDLLITLPFGRNLEKEADVIGLMLAARACFDVREIVIWKKMQLMKNSADDAVEIFSTHPSDGNRFEMLAELLPTALAEREKSKCPSLSFFDMAKRIENLERALTVKRHDILVPLHVDPKPVIPACIR